MTSGRAKRAGPLLTPMPGSIGQAVLSCPGANGSRRASYILGVAAGYVKVGSDRIEKDPDQWVLGALQLVFAKFAEFQSARQTHIWLRDEGIELPVKSRTSPSTRFPPPVTAKANPVPTQKRLGSNDRRHLQD